MNKSRDSNCDLIPETWGHTMETKPLNTTRILAINVNGIEVTRSNKKSDFLQKWVQKNHVNVTCIPETNVN